MPGSRKMPASTTEEVDGTKKNRMSANISSRHHENGGRNEGDTRLSNRSVSSSTTASSKASDYNCISNYQRFADNTTKNIKEDQVKAPPIAARNSNITNGGNSISSSCTRGFSKSKPISSSPSHTSDVPRSHIFSPQVSYLKVSLVTKSARKILSELDHVKAISVFL